jgi:hypothetical protein
MLSEADCLQCPQSEPKGDVSRAHRDREQKQRLQRLGGGPVAPYRPVSDEPLAEIAESLAEQNAEHDRPRGARREDPYHAGQQRRARAKRAAGDQRDREQHCAIADVSHHGSEHHREEERH